VIKTEFELICPFCQRANTYKLSNNAGKQEISIFDCPHCERYFVAAIEEYPIKYSIQTYSLSINADYVKTIEGTIMIKTEFELTCPNCGERDTYRISSTTNERGGACLLRCPWCDKDFVADFIESITWRVKLYTLDFSSEHIEVKGYEEELRVKNERGLDKS
jgi:transcription elongation factor Elf1